MQDDRSTQPPAPDVPLGPAGNGPWRVLLLDRTPGDPKWLLLTVTLDSDVRAAQLDKVGRFTDWPPIVEWVSQQVGNSAQLEDWRTWLIPVHDALAWVIR